MKDRSKMRLRCLAALFSIALLPACGGGTADDTDEGSSIEVSRDPVLLPGDARKIVEDLNAASDKANDTLDSQLEASIETSPARDIAEAFYKRLRALGRTTASGPPRSISDVTAYVPKQTSYPARFMAYVKLTLVDNPAEPAINRLRLYEKEAADEPWKLAMYITVPPEFTAPDIPLDADGFAEMVTDDEAETLKLEPSRVPEELSSYLSGYAAGTDSTTFAPGRFTNELAQSYKAAADKDTERQIGNTTEVSPGRIDAQAFQLRDGGALALFDTETVTTYTAAEGTVLNATAGSEGLLPQGSYKTIRRKASNMVAAIIPPAGAEGLVLIPGSTTGVTAFEHEP
jgi:hypothetical protein